MAAPAGAIAALLPIYLHFIGLPVQTTPGPALAFLYLLLIGFLMVNDPDLGQDDRSGCRANGFCRCSW